MIDSTANRIAALAGAGVAAVLVILGLTLDWATWVWLPLAVVLGAVAAIVLRSAVHSDGHAHPADHPHHPAVPPTQHPAPPPPRPAPRSATLSDLPLPSREPDYRFLFSATVYWEPQHHMPGYDVDGEATAKQLVTTRAVELARQHRPEDAVMATERLNSLLSERTPVAGQVVWATQAMFAVSNEDRRRLDELAELRKNRAVRHEQWAHQREARDYVANEVLRDPGSAVAWWFGRHLDHVEQLDQVMHSVKNLRRLTAAAHATEIPPWPPEAVEQPRQTELFDTMPPHSSPPLTPVTPVNPTRRLGEAVERLTADSDPALRATLYRRLSQLLRTQNFTAAAGEFDRRLREADDAVAAQDNLPTGDEPPEPTASSPAT